MSAIKKDIAQAGVCRARLSRNTLGTEAYGARRELWVIGGNLRLGALLPLNRAGRLGGDVVDHAVDAAHPVDDAPCREVKIMSRAVLEHCRDARRIHCLRRAPPPEQSLADLVFGAVLFLMLQHINLTHCICFRSARQALAQTILVSAWL